MFRTRVVTENGPVEIALTGDTLFQGSIGRSDLPGGNHEQLLQSIADKLLVLADDTAVLPGHGGSSTVAPNVGRTRFSLDSRDRNKEK